MTAKETLKEQIRKAFAGTPHPGDKNLRGSDEGNEPFMVERAFHGEINWQALTPEFIDTAPNGLGSALSFFSDAAFRFYLPAYLVADIEDRLERSEPLYHLTHGLDDRSRQERINPRRYGDRTWWDYRRERFTGFTREQAAAVVAYLAFKRESCDFERDRIDQALHNYWHERAA